jgi:hypothetical protein
MRVLKPRKRQIEVAFEAYGVGLVVVIDDPDLLEQVEARLPPGHRRCEPADEMPRLTLRRDSGQGFDVLAGSAALAMSAELEVALQVLDAEIRAEVALHSAGAVFIHAGTVGHRGRAILLPGPSFSGKTTLVAALVRAGAAYYSDEFAVLDKDGRVCPYPKPLSVRDEGERWGRSSRPEDLGGSTGEGPLPVGMIAVTAYRPGQSWEPQPRTSGQGAIALVANAVPARTRPEQVMAAARRAADGAVILEGDRGDADAAAADLLARADSMLEEDSAS